MGGPTSIAMPDSDRVARYELCEASVAATAGSLCGRLGEQPFRWPRRISVVHPAMDGSHDARVPSAHHAANLHVYRRLSRSDGDADAGDPADAHRERSSL